MSKGVAIVVWLLTGIVFVSCGLTVMEYPDTVATRLEVLALSLIGAASLGAGILLWKGRGVLGGLCTLPLLALYGIWLWNIFRIGF